MNTAEIFAQHLARLNHHDSNVPGLVPDQNVQKLTAALLTLADAITDAGASEGAPFTVEDAKP